MDRQSVFGIIDHTILKSDASQKQILEGCDNLLKYQFATICVHPMHVALCRDYLGDRAKIATVAGFPYGTNATAAKGYEASLAIKDGADEIDMVINVGALKEGRYDYCLDDIKAVVDGADGRLVKVIIETCLLNEYEKKKSCEIILKSGAGFVKTSTGFQGKGATVEDVALLRGEVGPDFGVKAAGGVRSFAECVAMIEAGANRIGTGSAVQIAENAPVLSDY